MEGRLRMRILIYGINYAPELTGIGKYTGEMAEWLAKEGHSVDVITSMPYYPEWEIHKEYKNSWWKKEVKNGVNIFRCPLYVPKNVSSIKRIIHEFSFLYTSSFRWMSRLFRKGYDLVICINPPFHLSINPYIYSLFRKTKIVTHIQDLQIDAAKDLNMLGDGKVLNIMFALERFFLRKSDYVSTLTEGMKKKVLSKNISEDKIVLFPNWVDTSKIRVLTKEESLRKQFNIQMEDFIILYSGNIGKKQGLNLLLEVAEGYVTSTNIHFVIVGAGAELDNLKQIAKDKKLSNVQFHPLQPYELLPALLAVADIHLVLQKKGAADLVMPSKLTGILAAGGCPIVSADEDSSLYNLIKDHQIGFLCEPESKEALKLTIDKALNSNIDDIRNKAREYAKANLDKDIIINRFLKEINQ